jgi:MFS family permease
VSGRHGDRTLVYTAAVLRGLAAGSISVLAAVYLAKRGFDESEVGFVLTAGFFGVAGGTAYSTFLADRVGRRRSLVALASLAAGGGLALALLESRWALAAAAFLGMLNTQGTDRGGAQALEQAILPATVSEHERTQVFAWYNALQDAGTATGALLAALPALLRDRFGVAEVHAYDATLVGYSLLLAGAALAYARLSPAAERAAAAPPAHVLHAPQAVRRAVRNFSLLAGLDAFGGGFIGSALIAYFLYLRFGVSEGALAALFLAARILTVLSHFVAAWLARRIGLVNTMVFTHLPSGLLLLTLPLAPTFPIAAALFVVREGLSEMDVPTRQSYLMAIVPAHERAWAAGMSQLARASGRIAAPALAGGAMQAGALWAPLVAGALIKIAYDLLLWRAFRRIRAPEEER